MIHLARSEKFNIFLIQAFETHLLSLHENWIAHDWHLGKRKVKPYLAKLALHP